MKHLFLPIWKAIVALRGRQAIIFLALCGVLFLVTSFAIRLPGVEAVDLQVTKGLQTLRSPTIDMLASGFTFLGNTLTLILLAAVAVIAFLHIQRPRAALLVAITLLGLPLNMLLKEVVGRPRPSADLVSVLLPTIGLSFPSGHAMASTMFYGFLAFMTWIYVPQNRWRLQATLGFGFTALMVSLSRIYVGAHWFSDVVGAWTAGIFFLLLLAEIYKHWNREDFAPVAEEPMKASSA